MCKWHQGYRTDKKPKDILNHRKHYPLKRTEIKKVSKKRKKELAGFSQIDLFNEIWEERPHVSELTGKALLPKGRSKWHWQFLHVLPKGTFTDLKLAKDNILLGLPDEHDHQDQYEVFVKKKEALKLQQYNSVKQWIK